MKKFYVQENIGKCKYVVSFHDGEKKHKDGSDFYDIRIFKNKRALGKCIHTLLIGGYRQDTGLKPWWEVQS